MFFVRIAECSFLHENVSFITRSGGRVYVYMAFRRQLAQFKPLQFKQHCITSHIVYILCMYGYATPTCLDLSVTETNLSASLCNICLIRFKLIIIDYSYLNHAWETKPFSNTLYPFYLALLMLEYYREWVLHSIMCCINWMTLKF